MASLLHATAQNNSDIPVKADISGSSKSFEFKQNLYRSYPDLKSNDLHWDKLLHDAQQVNIPSGTLLLQPDSACTQFMLIVEGCVRVYQQTPNDREVTLYRTYDGDLCVLSINGLMQNKNFDAFARAESDVTALSFTRDQFMAAMALYEPFRQFVLINLTSRFQDVLKLMEETVFEGLDTRLVCLLARISKQQNTQDIQITHQELASELGSSREVISRLLKAIERQGCIKLSRGKIHLSI